MAAEKEPTPDASSSDRDVEKIAAEVPKVPPSEPVGKTTSRAASVSPALETVPRSERRGLLGKFSIIPEVTNPYAYSNGTKWWMTVIVSFAAITSSTGSSIFYRECFETIEECALTD